ncbi:endonuclease/exonuclease/phosphatase family protein [Salsipaludibacter albus]|uniref:endonuclease/exonuclease/phosphatase family protein n=1 Tax=Salsipaludibacter albus TaxID=2849650 RepID=UPI001EE4728A|nr:endonuclease/exonuclease/phosphatase family protein [Salsipaludibacter albus]MBY5162230.1 endonuclease/exonuclease/phosphatase family protein [Salsipaludibacter albus]
MRSRTLTTRLLGLALLLAGLPASAGPDEPVRFATFNASLNRFSQGLLLADLQTVAGGGSVPQVEAVLEIIARNDADVLLVNEFDFDPAAADLFADLTGYPHHFTAPSNTGIPSGFDLNNDGSVGGPDDAFGFGFFPGQYGMLVLSRYPLPEARTFQELLWADMPGALLPELDGQPWFTDSELEVVRLSSKSHWDVTVDVPGRQDVHFLVSHPTPPVFDGAEDRNGRRNSDEIRFWVDYVQPQSGDWISDDDGVSGGLAPGSRFVVAGDLNSDPADGDSLPGAINQLLDTPQVNTKLTPTSEGAVEQTILQDSNNVLATAQYDTADFGEAEFDGPGNLRVDYVLPSRQLRMLDAGVDWPTTDDPDFDEVGVFPFPSSDHRLVWIDVQVN